MGKMLIKQYKFFFHLILLILIACSSKESIVKSAGSKKFDERAKVIWQSQAPKEETQAQTETLPSLWILAIGVRKYQEEDQNLKYADADAQVIAEKFKEQEEKLYKKVIPKVLVNEQVTRSSIFKEVKSLNKAAANDIVLIYLSGHGIYDELTDSYYFLPYPANQENFISEGLNIDDFKRAVYLLNKNINKLILMLDTCRSGAMRIGKGGIDPADLAVKFQQAEGLFTLASSKSGEISLENDEFKHGIFTYAILEAFEKGDTNMDGVLMFAELFHYISDRVPYYSGGKQHPYNPTSGTELPIALVEKLGFITINSIPWGMVKINGKYVGDSPLVNYQLPPRNYLLEIEKLGYEPYKESFQLNDKESIRRTVKLTPQKTGN
jgi:hypothetical protein